MKKFILLVLLTLGMSFTQNVQAQEELIKPDGTETNVQEEAYFKSLVSWKVLKDVKEEPHGLTTEETARVNFSCGTNFYGGSPAGHATYLGASGNYYTVYFEWHSGFNGGGATGGYVSGYYTYTTIVTSYNPC